MDLGAGRDAGHGLGVDQSVSRIGRRHDDRLPAEVGEIGDVLQHPLHADAADRREEVADDQQSAHVLRLRGRGCGG